MKSRKSIQDTLYNQILIVILLKLFEVEDSDKQTQNMSKKLRQYLFLKNTQPKEHAHNSFSEIETRISNIIQNLI